MNARDADSEARCEQLDSRPPRDLRPEHWGRWRLKYVGSRPMVNGLGEAGTYDEPSWPRYIRITDIAGPRTLRDDTFKSLPPLLAEQAPLAVGDLLLAAVGATYGKSYLRTRDDGPACFAGYLVRFSPGSSVIPEYVAYWTESTDYWNQVQSRVVQSTIQNFSAAKYRELVMPLPSLGEQHAIAAFLDRKTKRIDALVAKKRRLVELLQEKRTALVSHAVTKGLDPDVPVKDSGVEWLGEIPTHWKALPLRRGLLGIEQGWSPECGTRPADDQEWGVLKAGCVNHGEFAPGQNKALPSDLAPRPQLEVHAGELVGSVAYISKCRRRLMLSDKVFRLLVDSQRADAKFVALALNSGAIRAQIESILSGSVGLARNIGQPTVRELALCFPPLDEQRDIVRVLEASEVSTRMLVHRVDGVLERLREYRSALITAAVTGQIDVRTYRQEAS
jgi:type I restriction enzyme S subunit